MDARIVGVLRWILQRWQMKWCCFGSGETEVYVRVARTEQVGSAARVFVLGCETAEKALDPEKRSKLIDRMGWRGLGFASCRTDGRDELTG